MFKEALFAFRRTSYNRKLNNLPHPYVEMWKRVEPKGQVEKMCEFFGVPDMDHLTENTITNYVLKKHRPKLPIGLILMDKVLTKISKLTGKDDE